MDINEQLAILTNAVTNLMASNKALADQVKELNSNKKLDESKSANEEVIDDIMRHL